MDVYKMLGFNSAFSFIDCIHVAWSNYPSRLVKC